MSIALMRIFVVAFLFSAMPILGDAFAWNVVDAVLFVFLFRFALNDRTATGGTVYYPPLFIAVLAGLRRCLVSGPDGAAFYSTILFFRYSITAVILLLALAFTAGRPPGNRFYNCVVVGAGAWALGAVALTLAGVVSVPSFSLYLLGQSVTGAGAGGLCAVTGVVPGSSTPVEKTSG